MKKLLITGASGFLGSVLFQKAASQWETIGLYLSHAAPPVTSAKRVQLDLTSEKEVSALFQEFQPDVIIHTAAETRVDVCEANPDSCKAKNIEASRILSHFAQNAHSRLITISTDLVFDGTKGHYSESDPTHPLSLYAQTKVAAEKITLDTCPDAVVARIAIMYGKSPLQRYSFSEWMRKSWEKGQPTPLFYDQFRTPIWVDNLAEALLELASSDFKGILHLGGAQKIDRYSFGKLLAGILGVPENLLIPKSMFDSHPSAARPQDVSLNISRAQSILDTRILTVEEGLRLAYSQS
ncbi:MAG: SDR family oxidoreductase [Calditrichaeota bacterium]|nr:SDR family oxidoreductase [Calditrichota bacterium]